MKPLRIYIAGPMRGYSIWNFPAFDEARDLFISLGYDAISPADIDREEWGGDPVTDLALRAKVEEIVANWTEEDIANVIRRDCEAVLSSDTIAMLPGWEHSIGAVAEFFIARWKGITVLDATTGRALDYTPDLRAIMGAVLDYIEEVL